MGEIVQNTCALLHSMIVQTGTYITRPETWPLVVGYAPWVEHIWSNYMSNAIEYGGNPPLIDLGASHSEDGLVSFWVRDNGRGLSLDQQVRIFQPFTRLVERNVEGHGLGLAIVAHIVDKLGGQVGVESSMDEGSTFSFSLPLA